MNQTRINYLLKQFASGTLLEQEQQELETLLSLPNREELVQHITALIEQESSHPYSAPAEKVSETFRNVMAADQPTPSSTGTAQAPVRSMKRWWMAAASVAILLSAGAYIFLGNKEQQPGSNAIVQVKQDVDPGRNTAKLTLADGSVMELDSLGNGIITKQGSSTVVLKDGQLAYAPENTPPGTPVTIYNTITTPRGGEFTLTLADGTKVWLNAASSLKFPTTFHGAKREVELSGEAYMEVAEDKAHPFEVKIRDMNVAVLGTHFNIMGYEDEASIITTLVSGFVRVSSPGKPTRLLVPGEHAVHHNNSGELLVEKADVEEETAWKNGKTFFNGANIQQIMRQVSRWYNVEVVYKGNMTHLDFTCTVSRKDKLSKLLGMLELTGAVHFTIEGDKIIVEP